LRKLVSQTAASSGIKTLSVSVVIPTYERGDILSETIAMALAQDYPDFEVIVVDQSREVPESIRYLLESPPDHLTYLRLTTPNLPGARNAGVRIARGDIIAFIDDDVVLDRDYLTGMARHFQDPGVGAVMGMTLPPSGEEPHADEVSKRYFVTKAHPDGTAQVSWVVGCNSSYRKRAITEAGMCDELFTGNACSEDVDLSVRVRSLGYNLIYDPQVRLIHLELPSGGCANRSAEGHERRDEHSYRLFLYFTFKNRSILGFRETCRNVWGVYRSYALNRRLIGKNVKLLKRQFLFIKVAATAVRMCRPGRYAGTLPTD
jgi:GT2 family glycosyltransferase